jgi:hypothetical protein
MNTIPGIEGLVFEAGAPHIDKDRVAVFSLPSGWTCPFANDCLTKLSRADGSMVLAGKRFNCYTAMQEVNPDLRLIRWHNYSLLSSCGDNVEEMVKLIEFSLPDDKRSICVHYAGDFFSDNYFLAWMTVAAKHYSRLFYASTTSISSWVLHKKAVPMNFQITASVESSQIKMIPTHGLRYSKVVLDAQEAEDCGLAIDSSGKIRATTTENFGLQLHGLQESGTRALAAVKAAKTGSINPLTASLEELGLL